MGRWSALVMMAVMAAAWPASGRAADSNAPEARATETEVRQRGTATPGSERAIDRARSQGKAGRVLLDETRRDARQRPAPPANGGYRSPTLDPQWRHRND